MAVRIHWIKPPLNQVMCICKVDSIDPASLHKCTCKKKTGHQETSGNSLHTEEHKTIHIEEALMGLLNSTVAESLTTGEDECNQEDTINCKDKFNNIENNNTKGDCYGTVIGDFDAKTEILQLINGGSFGEIYLGKCLSTHKDVAVKAEKHGTGAEKLLHEGNVYYKLQNGPGIPKVFWYGMHGSSYNFLVMELLGPSLAHIFHSNGERFSLPTVIKLQLEILNVLNFMHSQNYIHRDISPANFVIGGAGNESKIYLIDFGLAKKCSEAGRIIVQGRRRSSFSMKKPLVGTPRFVSLGMHQGTPEGRKDDLESLAYMLIYFLKGSLPWQKRQSSIESNRLDEIAELKLTTTPTELCSSIPPEFSTFLDYVRSMRPTDMPDYDGLVTLFENLAMRESIDLKTLSYEWLT